MKLTRFNLSQPENNKVEPANPLTEENKVNYEGKEVSQPQVANEPQTIVEYEIYADSNIDPSIGNYQLVKDRERRQSKPNPRCEIQNLTDFALISRESLQHSEPTSFEEAISTQNFGNWRRAMEEEIKSLLKNKTRKLVKKLEN